MISKKHTALSLPVSTTEWTASRFNALTHALNTYFDAFNPDFMTKRPQALDVIMSVLCGSNTPNWDQIRLGIDQFEHFIGPFGHSIYNFDSNGESMRRSFHAISHQLLESVKDHISTHDFPEKPVALGHLHEKITQVRQQMNTLWESTLRTRALPISAPYKTLQAPSSHVIPMDIPSEAKDRKSWILDTLLSIQEHHIQLFGEGFNKAKDNIPDLTDSQTRALLATPTSDATQLKRFKSTYFFRFFSHFVTHASGTHQNTPILEHLHTLLARLKETETSEINKKRALSYFLTSTMACAEGLLDRLQHTCRLLSGGALAESVLECIRNEYPRDAYAGSEIHFINRVLSNFMEGRSPLLDQFSYVRTDRLTWVQLSPKALFDLNSRLQASLLTLCVAFLPKTITTWVNTPTPEDSEEESMQTYLGPLTATLKKNPSQINLTGVRDLILDAEILKTELPPLLSVSDCIKLCLSQDPLSPKSHSQVIQSIYHQVQIAPPLPELAMIGFIPGIQEKLMPDFATHLDRLLAAPSLPKAKGTGLTWSLLSAKIDYGSAVLSSPSGIHSPELATIAFKNGLQNIADITAWAHEATPEVCIHTIALLRGIGHLHQDTLREHPVIQEKLKKLVGHFFAAPERHDTLMETYIEGLVPTDETVTDVLHRILDAHYADVQSQRTLEKVTITCILAFVPHLESWTPTLQESTLKKLLPFFHTHLPALAADSRCHDVLCRLAKQDPSLNSRLREYMHSIRPSDWPFSGFPSFDDVLPKPLQAEFWEKTFFKSWNDPIGNYERQLNALLHLDTESALRLHRHSQAPIPSIAMFVEFSRFKSPDAAKASLKFLKLGCERFKWPLTEEAKLALLTSFGKSENCQDFDKKLFKSLLKSQTALPKLIELIRNFDEPQLTVLTQSKKLRAFLLQHGSSLA